MARDQKIEPLPPSRDDLQFEAFRDFVLAEIVRVFSGQARDCIVCRGYGSVDPSERVVWSKPELGTIRDEVNPRLEVCPACKGSGKETRHGTQQDRRSAG